MGLVGDLWWHERRGRIGPDTGLVIDYVDDKE
jgi:hypothetical protein